MKKTVMVVLFLIFSTFVGCQEIPLTPEEKLQNITRLHNTIRREAEKMSSEIPSFVYYSVRAESIISEASPYSAFTNKKQFFPAVLISIFADVKFTPNNPDDDICMKGIVWGFRNKSSANKFLNYVNSATFIRFSSFSGFSGFSSRVYPTWLGASRVRVRSNYDVQALGITGSGKLLFKVHVSRTYLIYRGIHYNPLPEKKNLKKATISECVAILCSDFSKLFTALRKNQEAKKKIKKILLPYLFSSINPFRASYFDYETFLRKPAAVIRVHLGNAQVQCNSKDGILLQIIVYGFGNDVERLSFIHDIHDYGEIRFHLLQRKSGVKIIGLSPEGKYLIAFPFSSLVVDKTTIKRARERTTLSDRTRRMLRRRQNVFSVAKKPKEQEEDIIWILERMK